MLHQCEQEGKEAKKCAYSTHRGRICTYPMSDEEWSETNFEVPCPWFKTKTEYRIENRE